jgi:predicted acyltransferase
MTGPPPSAPWSAPPGPYPGASTTTSGLAIASLVTGLLFWCLVVPGIVAVVLGYLALEEIADSGGRKRGRGMAIAGIVLGWVGIGALGLAALGWVISLLVA